MTIRAPLPPDPAPFLAAYWRGASLPVTPLAPGVWRVPSTRGGRGPYYVTRDGARLGLQCSCPAGRRGAFCKHVARVIGVDTGPPCPVCHQPVGVRATASRGGAWQCACGAAGIVTPHMAMEIFIVGFGEPPDARWERLLAA
jgi:hypothetical protein